MRVLALAFAAMALAAAPAAADQWEKTFETPGRPSLALVCGDAAVHVETWDRRAVGLRVTTEGWRIGDRGVRVTATQDGDHVYLEVREPSYFFFFGLTRRSVQVEAMLPREADLDARTADGRVEVTGLRGLVHLHTGDGAVEAVDLAGDVRIETGDGRVRAHGLDGALATRSGDGPMEIEGRFERLDVETGDGRVEVTALEGSRLAAPWSFHSGDGPLTLAIPRTLKADLDLHTGDGGIRLGLPVQVEGTIARSTVRGSINGGGPLLRMRAGDGAIRIEPI